MCSLDALYYVIPRLIEESNSSMCTKLTTANSGYVYILTNGATWHTVRRSDHQLGHEALYEHDAEDTPSMTSSSHTPSPRSCTTSLTTRLLQYQNSHGISESRVGARCIDRGAFTR